jgi:hypothetical protein
LKKRGVLIVIAKRFGILVLMFSLILQLISPYVGKANAASILKNTNNYDHFTNDLGKHIDTYQEQGNEDITNVNESNVDEFNENQSQNEESQVQEEDQNQDRVDEVDAIEGEDNDNDVHNDIQKNVSLRATKETITINKGESYWFIESTTSAANIRNDASKKDGKYFDYITYDRNGKIKRQGLNTDDEPYITLGERVRITVTSELPVTFTYYPAKTSVEPSTNPALVKASSSSGQSLIFINEGDIEGILENDASSTKKYDFSVYDKNGDLIEYAADSFAKPVVPPGGKIVVTNRSDQTITFGGGYELFNVNDSDEEALIRQEIVSGQSYSFINTSTTSKVLINDASSSENKMFDYALYNSDGTAKNEGIDNTSDPSIPTGGKIVVTVEDGNPVTFVYHPMVFKCDVSEDPALLKITLNKNESYSFTNIGDTVIYLENNADATKRFDYTLYDRDGVIIKQASNANARPSIPAGGRIVVTTVSDQPITYYGYYKLLYGDTSTEPALRRVTVNKGESYVFTNITTTSKQIKNDGVAPSRTFDYAIYLSDGTGYKLEDNSVTEYYIPSGAKIVVTTVSDEPVTFIYSQESFKSEKSFSPALLKKTINNGETLSLYNHSGKEAQVKNNASTTNKYDYTLFDEKGNVIKEVKDTTEKPFVPSKGRITVTPKNAPVTFYTFYDLFTEINNDDMDGDGIRDDIERNGIKIGYQGHYIRTITTDPTQWDTDGDGINDGAELLELKYYNSDGNFYEAIDDPTSSVNGSLVQGVLFEIPILYDYQTDDIETIKSILLQIENYKDKLKQYHKDIIGYANSDSLSSLGKDQVLDYVFKIDNAAVSFYTLTETLATKIISTGNILDWNWLIENDIEYMTTYGDDNTPSARKSGASNWLAVFGTEVHQQVFQKFKNDPRIRPHGFTNFQIGETKLRPDMVYDTGLYGNMNYAEIFELKPITWSLYVNPKNYALAQAQLNKYISAYKYHDPDKTVAPGTIATWDVIYHIVDIPKYKTAVVLYQFDNQPGMVYYAQFRSDRTHIDKYVVKMNRKKYTTTINGKKVEVETIAKDTRTGKVAAIAMIGGATLIVIGTIAEDIFTAGTGIADDPVSFAAAGGLLQNAITILRTAP